MVVVVVVVVTGRMSSSQCVLGIDIGTTSVKCCLVDVASKEVLSSQKKDTCSNVPSELGTQFYLEIWAQLDNFVGIRKSLWRFTFNEVSNLYTWQDSRCSQEFLSSLPVPESHIAISSGYGCATLLWFSKHKPDHLTKFDRAATIHDFLEWNTELLQGAGLPLEFLPEVVDSGKEAGKLKVHWYGIPAGTPVLASLEFCKGLDFKPCNKPPSSPSPIEYFPFFKSYLAVAASLNGGNVLAAFVRMVQQWSLDLGFSVPQSKIWQRILELGGDGASESNLLIEPTLFGERHSPLQTASVSNVDLGNLSLGQVMRSLCKGVITNMHSMMPRSMLEENEITSIICGGSALARNPILLQELEHAYQLPTTLDSRGDAAYGSALAAINAAAD
ncbi:Sedoheptulokinase [Portunus trituberculatus]|uniref:Sedoheptulokinase n=1 Tax=Portunus trituberculatus TaxID=210409 RepID=A0A5B7E3R2_PORTR|nr:Sedoheptulokinase [Portunus trituberculatus]